MKQSLVAFEAPRILRRLQLLRRWTHEQVGRPSQAFGLVQALQQSVGALAIATHEHGEAIAAVGVRRQYGFAGRTRSGTQFAILKEH